jgi:hypothetical protein
MQVVRAVQFGSGGHFRPLCDLRSQIEGWHRF